MTKLIILEVAVMFSTFMLCLAGLNYYFERNRIMIAPDPSEIDPSPEGSFLFCNKGSMFEAFQPKPKILPDWAMNNEHIMVVVAPRYEVRVTTASGDVVTATDTDYIVRLDGDVMCVIPEEEFQHLYANIQIIEE